jgi:hypothetical protein
MDILTKAYYQFVSRALLPNVHEEYKRLGRILCKARDGGLVDWDAIEDRTREVNGHNSWSSPASIVSAVARQYQEDLWAGQLYRPEVWIEKDALLGVIEGVCTEYRVPYYAHRGNDSQVMQHEAGKRFAEYLDQGLTPVVLHLADHDPKGIDMTRDNRERLSLYARDDIEVRRIALNMDQVRQYNPPPNFAKDSDTMTEAYRAEYGDECWELDALDPTVIANLIRRELDDLIERDEWDAALSKEQEGRDLLAVSRNWTKVTNLMEG